jgi:hypothetical protein
MGQGLHQQTTSKLQLTGGEGIEKMEKTFKNASSYTYSPSYTFPGNLPLEIFTKPSISTPALNEIFTIRQGIRTDEYLILQGQLNKILGAMQGCEPSYTTGGTFSDRKITVGKFGAYMKWCKEDFISTASVLTNDPSWVADGLDGYDASAKVRKVWMDEMIDALRRDYFNVAFFANDSVADTYWNQIEGLFVKLYDANASYCVKRVANSFGNSQTTVLTTDEALDAIRRTHTDAPILLKQIDPSQKVFWVTGAVYENLMASYESKNGGTETQLKYLEDGRTSLKFRGIDVRPIYAADNTLTSDSTNPFYGNIRNFIIYTPKASSKFSNLVFGTERAADLDKIKMFFDEKDDVTYAKHEARFGVQFIHCDLTAFHD